MRRNLKKILDRFYTEYDLKSRVEHDPIEFPHRYSRAEDIEIAGMIASSLSYGNITLFKPVINKILSIPSGKPLREFVINFDPAKNSRLFDGISYRFNSEKDIACLVYFIKSALIEYGSLKNLFYSFYGPADGNIAGALKGFIKYFISLDTAPIYGKRTYPMGLRQFFPSPADGSACKRLNLYLRWMVRSGDGVDFGIWNGIHPSKLIIPLDTHIARICSHIGLTQLKNAGWKMAEEITDNLKRFDPEDPVKYDFALCHLGISGKCPIERDKEKCRGCSLKEVCD